MAKAFEKVYVLVAMMLIFVLPVVAQNTLTTLGLTSSTPSAAAYSLRKLSSTYAGPLVRIYNGTNFYDVYPDATTGWIASTSKISAVVSTYNAAVAASGTSALSTITASATIAVWYDQSGRGRHVYQATTANQPDIWTGSAVKFNGNNKQAAYFDGTSTYLQTTSAATWLSGIGYSLSAVVQTPGTTNTNYFLGNLRNGSTPSTGLHFGQRSNTQFTLAQFSNDADYIITQNTGTSLRTAIKYAGSGGSAAWLNGSSLGTNIKPDANLSISASTTIGLLNIGCGHQITTSGFWLGYISEILIFDNELSDAERQIVENNQSIAYGVTVPNAPTISVHPSSTAQSVCLNGTPTNLSVTASVNSGSITYQWYSNASASNTTGTLISGATSSSYSPNTTASGSIYYYCVLTNSSSGYTTTSNVSGAVTVRTAFTAGAISITGETICNAGTPTVIGSSTASSGGDGTITYSWRSSADSYGSTIAGATSATYTPPAGLTSTTSYRRYAKDGTCSTTPTVSTGTWTTTVSATPTTANAGSDQTGSATCGLTTVTLAANTPTIGTGAWSIVSGTGGTITTSSSPTSIFSGTAGTTYTLRWTISNSPCTSSTDDVVITFNQNPTTSNAGSDQTGASTCGLTSVTLAGNTPTVGTGAWSIVSGTGGTITTASSPTSTFTGTAGSTYTLRWTISNSPCTASTDDVVITFNQNPTTANAGSDQTGASTCGLTSVTLAGNTPTVGTGAWSIVSGTGGTITTSSSPTSTFSGTAGSTYTLRWTISNSPCTASTDDVVITFNQNPTTANAGSDQTGASTCGLTSVTLAGNTPTVGTGAWSIVSGTGGTITTSSSPTSTFSGTAGSTYTLRWTISNSPCTASTDDVVITFNQNPTAGITNNTGTTILTCTTTSISLTATGGGTYSWSNGSTVVGASAALSVTTPATYTVTVTGSNGCTATSAVTITQNTTTSSASVLSGTATITSGNSTNLSVAITGGTSPYTVVYTDGTSNFTVNSYVSGSNISVSPTSTKTYTLVSVTGANGCAGTGNSGSAVVTVNAGPTASVISGTATICSGASTNLSVAITGGTSPYTVVYYNGSSNTTVNSYTSGANISVSPTTTTTYTIVSVTDANSQVGTGNSGSAVVTVNALPTPTFTSQAGSSVCLSTDVTYTTQSGQSSYAWTVPGTLGTDYSITSGGIGSTSNTVTLRWLTSGSKTVTINYNNASGCSAASATSSTATTVRPSFTTGAITTTGETICYGGTPASTIGNGTASSGGDAAITYSWRSSTDGYTAAILGAASVTYLPPAGLTATTSYRRYANDGTCNTTPTVSTGTWTVTVSQIPTTANAGPDQNVTASGGAISATLAGNTPTVGTGLWTIVSGTGGTITTPTSPTSTFSGSSGITYVLRWTISNSPCNSSSDEVTVTSTFIWTGLGGDDLWNNGNNWSPGTAPIATSDIIINSGTPKMNIDYTAEGTLTIGGTGTLTINAGKTLTVASGAVVNFGDKSVTIKSDITGTAQIGKILGTLNGATNVTVERYIPATGRRYRMIAPSVNTTGSIKANWMEGNMNTSGTNVNTVAGYGTQITGPGGNANGFDASGTNSASLYLTSNGVNLTYTSVSNTTSSLSALTGYFLFLRGDRSMNMSLSNTNVPPNPVPLPTSVTTLRATGTVVTGTVSLTSSLSTAAGGFSLITNPYPAAIDWALVYAASSNLNNYYSYWDPNMGFRGGFVTVNTGGTNSSGTSKATNVIQSGQAFFVTTIANGAASVSIQESHKVGVNGNNEHRIFKANTTVDGIVSTKVKGISTVWENYQPNLQPMVSTIPEFRISLYYTEASGNKRLTDGAVALFDNQYTSALDGNDAVDAPNWDENIAIMRNGQNLAIESRSVLNENDTLAISMSAMKAMNYELQFQGSNFGSTLLQPLLIDNYLNTLTPLSLTQSTTVPFTVTTTPTSSSKDRFKVVFKTSVLLPFTVTKITATKKNESVQVDWEVKTDEELKSFDVQRSSDGRTFVKLATVASLGKGITIANYSWVDNNPLMGANYYRIKVIPLSGKERVSPVAMVTMDKNQPSMVVYPNPTEGNDFSIKLSNLTKGSYQVIVTTATGQQVLVKTIDHPGGTAVQSMVFANDITKGVYRVQVKGEGLSLLSSIIKN